MLKIHFLNVGHGDCIIVEFIDNNRKGIIDINSSSDFDKETEKELVEENLNKINDQIFKSIYYSNIYTREDMFKKAGYTVTLQDPIKYFQDNNFGSVFRFISTHPHMDHLSGLRNFKDTIGLTNIWVLNNQFTQNLSDLSDSQKEDWKLYKSFRDCNERQYDGVYVVRPKEGDSLDFWKEDGIIILAPNNDLLEIAKKKDNPNIMSYVLLIKYGQTKIILGGDAEEDTWKYLTENYSESLKDITILKAAHHGRDSGYYQPAVKLMNPEYVVVSVGKKPATDASSKYKQYCDNVYSTRWKGNIVFECYSNGIVFCKTQYEN
jgi:competence protein ComEC